jgi:diguanylate cyclase (GGDEF)-like protein
VVAGAFGQQPGAPPSKLPTLSTAHAAHSLPAEEAKRGYSVRLRAVVTYYDPYTDPHRGAFFACDATGCICVLVPPLPILPLRAGTLIDLRGVSDPGNYAPIVVASKVEVLGQSRVPPNPPRRSLTELLTGEDDGQWVEVEGVVHSVERSGHNVTFVLALRDGMIRGVAPFEKDADYARLVDAKVVIHANAAPLWTKNRQMVGARLLFPSLAQVRIEELSPEDPFGLPVRTISSLLQFAPDVSVVHRVRVRGRVALRWPGQLYIQDGSQGIFIPTVQKTPLALGDTVDVVGFPSMGEYTLMLEDAVFKREGGGQIITAAFVTAQEAMKGDYEAKLIRIQGRLVQQDRTSEYPTLVLSSGGRLFLAILPTGTSAYETTSWQVGSELQLTGVCSVQVDKHLSAEREGAAQPKSFRVLLRSARDVAVLQQPSWWTPRRTLMVLSVCVLAILFGILWVAALKRRVRVGTETVRAMLEATAEGILVVDSAERIVAHNRKFATMWTVPEPILKLFDHRLMLDFVKSQLRDPEGFTSKIRAAYGNTKAKTDDVIELKDGRAFERHSEPLTVEGRYVGRVWGYRDVTEAREWTRQLQELAQVDGLTCIRNRRAIFEFLSNELARGQRSGDPVTVIMADLDGFKKINDHYGHAAGDAVLRETAQRLSAAVRMSDAVGRYGGEEFLIVLPGCDEDSARPRAEECRRIVESLPISCDMREVGVTCSFGVAWTRDGSYSMGPLLQEADGALYRAKQAGRNCVVLAEPVHSEVRVNSESQQSPNVRAVR